MSNINPKITETPVKSYRTSDGKTFPTAPQAGAHQAGVDFTKTIEEVDGVQYVTTDKRTWNDIDQANSHQAMLDFEPLLKRHIGDNPELFAVNGAETRFRTGVAPFLGSLVKWGVDLTPALPEVAVPPAA